MTDNELLDQFIKEHYSGFEFDDYDNETIRDSFSFASYRIEHNFSVIKNKWFIAHSYITMLIYDLLTGLFGDYKKSRIESKQILKDIKNNLKLK